MLLFCDGMDHYNATQAPSKWELGNIMTYNATNGRFGGGSLASEANNTPKNASKLITSGSSFILGLALKVDTLIPTSPSVICRLIDTATTQVDLRTTPLGQIAVYTNNSQVGVSAGGLITLGVWNFIEWKVTIASSTGTNQCVVHLNNDEILNLTAVSTKTTGNTTANIFSIGQTVFTTGGFNYDDVYVCDNTGSTNNDFLGDCRIETLYPSGAGNYTDFVANGAGTNWGCVSEHPADDDTTFVSSNNVNDIDSYAFTNPSGTPTAIFAIQANMRARKDNAGTRTFGRLVRISGTDYVGSGFALGTNYSLFREIIEQNPNTNAAWTSSDINGLEAGVKVLT